MLKIKTGYDSIPHLFFSKAGLDISSAFIIFLGTVFFTPQPHASASELETVSFTFSRGNVDIHYDIYMAHTRGAAKKTITSIQEETKTLNSSKIPIRTIVFQYAQPPVRSSFIPLNSAAQREGGELPLPRSSLSDSIYTSASNDATRAAFALGGIFPIYTSIYPPDDSCPSKPPKPPRGSFNPPFIPNLQPYNLALTVVKVIVEGTVVSLVLTTSLNFPIEKVMFPILFASLYAGGFQLFNDNYYSFTSRSTYLRNFPHEHSVRTAESITRQFSILLLGQMAFAGVMAVSDTHSGVMQDLSNMAVSATAAGIVIMSIFDIPYASLAIKLSGVLGAFTYAVKNGWLKRTADRVKSSNRCVQSIQNNPIDPNPTPVSTNY